MIQILKKLLLPGSLRISMLTLLFIFAASVCVNAKNYYFSTSLGSDSYTSTQAQSTATPWKSITKLNAIFSTLVAGDSILFKRGDIFYGTIITNKSGASSNPIVISAYGTGTKPVISGFTTLSSWSDVGNGVYQAAAPAADSDLNMVTLNNIPQAVGRYPNATDVNGGYLKYESFADTTSITDNELTSTINWTGAEVVIRKKLWVLDRCKIINHTGGTITYINPGVSDFDGSNNYGYFIQRDPRTLDRLGEWYFNGSTKNLQMYFGTAIPSSYSIKISTVDTLLSINTNSYINVSNIAFEGANSITVYVNNTSNINIQNCDISNAGECGIISQNVSNILVENCTTNNVLSNAIKLNNTYVANTTVRNCVVKNTGTLPGMGLNAGHSYKGIIAFALNNVEISYNKVDTTGFVAIEFEGNNVTVNNNVVNYYCYVKDDAGGIYTWSQSTDANPGTVYTNRVIRDNIIMNGIGSAPGPGSTSTWVSGIHLDGRSVNVDVLNNTIFNCNKNGIHSNNPVGVNIKGNTFFNNLNAVSIMRWAATGDIKNLAIKNNISYPKTDAQRNFYYTNNALNEPVVTTFQSDVQSLADIDSNYYSTSNPAGFKFEYYLTTGGAGVPASPQSLDGWSSFSKHDSFSKKPFREAPEYMLRSVIGSNLFTNGAFTSNITGLILFGANVTATWDNTSKITGTGSLRLDFTSPVANKVGTVYSAIGAVSSTKNYILRFSTLGTTSYGIVNAYIRKTASPYSSLIPLQTKTFGTGRTDHEFLFAAPTTDAGGSFVIEIEQNSGTTYIDNIEFYEADATPYNIDDYLRFEYNPTSVAKVVALGANYIGVDAAYYPGTITLQPYTSKILVKDTSILRQALAAQASAPAINCFGGTSTVTVTATGGISPYTGTGTFAVAAGTYTYTVKDLTGATATTTVTITQPSAVLKATATAGSILIYGGTTTVTVSGTGGTSPYTGTGSFSNVAAGTYTYTVRDSKGCTASATITITQPAILKATAAAAAINCFGGTTTMTVSATGGISPYTGTGNFIVNAGTYNYTVTDAAGATNTISLSATQPSTALTATAVAGTISIFGGTTSVIVSASGGTSPYTGTGTISNVSAGTYTYTVTDSKGCSSSATITITQPSATISVAATTPSISCFGSTANVSVTATGGVTPYTGTGNYTVGAGNGSIKISFPSVIVGTNTALYYTIGAVSAAKNYILRFSTLGTTSAGSLKAGIRQTSSPWAMLTTWQTASFGTGRKDFEFVFTAPTADVAASFIITIDQGSGTTYFDNIAFFEVDNSNNLKGSNLYAYGSFESGINNLLVGSSNGNQIATWDTTSKIPAVYYFTVKDANNSTATAVVKTTQPDLLQVTATPGIISAYGGTTSVVITPLGGTAPYAGASTKNNVAAGTYTYTIMDFNGCSASTTITATQPAPTALLPVTTSAKINCFGKTTAATATAIGGVTPYTGTGNYTVDAGKGSIKVSFPSVIAGIYTTLYYTIGAVSSAKSYIIRFSTVGTTASGSLRVGIRQTSSPWAMLTAWQTASFGTARKDYEFIFTAPTTEATASFIIGINQNSGTTYVDNIAFFEADGSNNLKGSNLYAYGSFESGISNLLVVSSNANHIATWDTTSKITATYYYPITDALGNSVTSVVNTTQPAAPLQVTAAAGIISTTGGSTTVTVTATGGTAPYTGTGSFTNVKVGTYTYTVTDAAGCVASQTITITQTAARTAIPVSATSSINSNKELAVTAYPNPSAANFSLVLEGGTTERVAFAVTTIDGKPVYAASGNSNQQYTFGSGFSTGLYILKITQGNIIKTLKLIKIK